jgi:hypothetical protein
VAGKRFSVSFDGTIATVLDGHEIPAHVNVGGASALLCPISKNDAQQSEALNMQPSLGFEKGRDDGVDVRFS